MTTIELHTIELHCTILILRDRYARLARWQRQYRYHGRHARHAT